MAALWVLSAPAGSARVSCESCAGSAATCSRAIQCRARMRGGWRDAVSLGVLLAESDIITLHCPWSRTRTT